MKGGRGGISSYVGASGANFINGVLAPKFSRRTSSTLECWERSSKGSFTIFPGIVEISLSLPIFFVWYAGREGQI